MAAKKTVKSYSGGQWYAGDIMNHNEKQYEGEYEEDRALSLFFATKDDGTPDEDSQMESFDYAEYYAKRNSFEAKCFIIRAINEYSEFYANKEVSERAKNAFWRFIVNFVRREAESYYAKFSVIMKSQDKYDIIQEAVSGCYPDVMEALKRYDYVHQPTTFLKWVIVDSIQKTEAARSGHDSKFSMNSDSKVNIVCKHLEEKGQPITLKAVADELESRGYNLTITQVQQSLNRLIAEKSTLRIDDENNLSTKIEMGSQVQRVFKTPEQMVEEKERTARILSAIESLDEDERDIFCVLSGFSVIDGILVDEPPMKISKLSKERSLRENDLTQIYFRAKEKIRRFLSEDESDTSKSVSKVSFLFDSNSDDGDCDDLEFLSSIRRVTPSNWD